MTIADFDTDVLIVGAGPVGLALATELTIRGRNVQIVEAGDRSGTQPRAKTTNVRTMTHMRRWGLAPEMRRRTPLPADFPRRVRFATRLFGKEIYSFENAFAAEPVQDDRFPEHAEFIPQFVVEGVLFDHVKGQDKAQVHLKTKLESYEALPGGGVRAVATKEDGTRVATTARFLVGADGAASTVRDLIGTKMQGDAQLVSFVTLVLKIPGLSDAPDLREALFHWIVAPDAACVLGPMGRDDIWYWASVVPKGDRSSDDDLLAKVRSGIGRDYDMEILARDPWNAHKLLAGTYRSGDVFLVGDACHLHSPFGGHGMNQGVSDAVDLGWKLAAMLDGWGGPGLLESYEIERRPAHQLVLDTSTENLALLSDHFLAEGLEDDSPEGDALRAETAKAVKVAKTPEFHSIGVVIGYRYTSPMIAEDPGEPPAFSVTEYRPDGYPGTIAPHLWLSDGTSLYDGFGPAFTLLRTGAVSEAGEAAMLEAAFDLQIPLKTSAPEDARLRALYGGDYALIRPDQHIAWRGNDLTDAERILRVAVGAA